jgi:hypothetical protein
MPAAHCQQLLGPPAAAAAAAAWWRLVLTLGTAAWGQAQGLLHAGCCQCALLLASGRTLLLLLLLLEVLRGVQQHREGVGGVDHVGQDVCAGLRSGTWC